MKKLLALVLVLCLAIGVTAALAEDEEDFRSYTEDNPEAMPYVSAWVAEDGDWRVEGFDEDSIKIMVVHKLGDNKEDVWEYTLALNPEKTALVAVPLGLHYRQDTVSLEWDETYYEDGDATFTITEDGKLVWQDVKEDAGKGLEFQKIGSFFGCHMVKDDIDVLFYDWYDGQYDIRCYKYDEKGEIAADAILKGDYDPETDTVTAEGFFDPDAPFTVVFSYNEQNQMVWTEDGVSTVMDLSYRTE